MSWSRKKSPAIRPASPKAQADHVTSFQDSPSYRNALTSCVKVCKREGHRLVSGILMQNALAR